MLYAFLSLLLIGAPLMATTAPAGQAQESTHREITADELKSWYDQNKPIVVLDARSKPYFDGTLLPKAKWLSVESTDAEILAAVPSKDSIIVVYCAGADCPASGMLYDKLTRLGYTNVYEYRGGLKDWIKQKFPTIK